MDGSGAFSSRRRRARSAIRTLVVIAIVGAGLAVGASPAAAAGTIALSPNTGLVDGQVVNINGSGWEPGQVISWCQLVPSIPPDATTCFLAPNFANADGEGNFSIPLTVRRLISVGFFPSRLVDCAAPSLPCVLVVADPSDPTVTTVSETLNFTPAPPLVLPGFAGVAEGDSGTTSLSVGVGLSYASTQTVSAQWATTTSCPGFDVADPATDYTATSGTVTFEPGATSAGLGPISVNGDVVPEPDECVPFAFTNPSNATIGTNQFGNSLAIGEIQNDDSPVPDLVIKRRSDGTLFFDGSGVIDPVGYGHTITPGGTWTYAVLVQNDGVLPGDLVVKADASVASPFEIQYFYGYYDVTAAVEGTGLLLPAMAPAETRPLAVRFRADPGAPGDATAEIILRATTAPVLPGVRDALRLRVTASDLEV